MDFVSGCFTYGSWRKENKIDWCVTLDPSNVWDVPCGSLRYRGFSTFSLHIWIWYFNCLLWENTAREGQWTFSMSELLYCGSSTRMLFSVGTPQEKDNGSSPCRNCFFLWELHENASFFWVVDFHWIEVQFFIVVDFHEIFEWQVDSSTGSRYNFYCGGLPRDFRVQGS